MANIINLDHENQPIGTSFVLANRSGNKYGIIKNVCDLKRNYYLNEPDEGSFTCYRMLDGNEYEHWDKLVDFMLLYDPYSGQWYEMYADVTDDGSSIKKITFMHLEESELSHLRLYDTEINTETDIVRSAYTTTYFYNPDNPKGSLLHRILSDKASHYTIAHVDDSLANSRRIYSFTWDGDSVYDALMEVAEEVQCLFVFGEPTENSIDGKPRRTISCYDLLDYCMDCGTRDNMVNGVCPKCGSRNVKMGYGENTSAFISTDNFAQELTLKTDEESVKTCFRLRAGDDDMTSAVVNINPNGTPYIWNFPQTMRSTMSKELRTALDNYDAEYTSYAETKQIDVEQSYVDTYNNLVNKYKQYNDKLETVSYPIVGFNNFMSLYYNAMDLYGYLNTSMMPQADGIDDTTVEEQIAKLTEANLSPIGVTNTNTLSLATMDSAVKNYAKVYVNTALYKISIKESKKDGLIWSGIITLTSYLDEEDTADTQTLNITFNADELTFVKQKVEKVLAGIDEDDLGIVALFDKDSDEFADKIKEYSLQRLQSLHDSCGDCLEVMIEAGFADDETSEKYKNFYRPYFDKSNLLSAEIVIREDEVNSLYSANDDTVGVLNHLQSVRRNITTSLNILDYLGEELWSELSSYRIDDEYTNDNYISDGLSSAEMIQKAQEFYDSAVKELAQSCNAQYEVESTVNNLFILESFADIREKCAIGNWIRMEIDGEVYKLRITEIDIDENDWANIEIRFSDIKTGGSGDISDIQSVLDSARSMATSYKYVQRQANKGDTANSLLERWVQNGLDLTNSKIVNNADNQNVVYGTNGITIRRMDDFSGEYNDKQVKIINNGLYFTDDNWETAKTGIGEFIYYNPETGEYETGYGVIAETVVGDIILGNNLGIYSVNGSMKMDENGMVVTTTEGTTPFVIQRDNQDGTVTKLMYVDDNGTLVFSGDMMKIDEQSATSWIEDRAVSFNMDITNDDFIIKNDDYSLATTSIKCRFGKNDVSSKVTYTFDKTDGITDEWDAETGTYKVTNMTDMQGSVTVTARLDENRSQTKTITVNKVYDGESAVTVVIDSSNGNIFRNVGVHTILTATVYRGTVDITDTITKFYWYKHDLDGKKDEDWTRVTDNNYIVISQSDVTSKATFYCEVDVADVYPSPSGGTDPVTPSAPLDFPTQEEVEAMLSVNGFDAYVYSETGEDDT